MINKQMQLLKWATAFVYSNMSIGYLTIILWFSVGLP